MNEQDPFAALVVQVAAGDELAELGLGELVDGATVVGSMLGEFVGGATVVGSMLGELVVGASVTGSGLGESVLEAGVVDVQAGVVEAGMVDGESAVGGALCVLCCVDSALGEDAALKGGVQPAVAAIVATPIAAMAMVRGRDSPVMGGCLSGRRPPEDHGTVKATGYSGSSSLIHRFSPRFRQ